MTPFNAQLTALPRLESVAELRDALVLNVEGLVDADWRARLLESLYAAEIPAFHVTVVFDDMDAADRFHAPDGNPVLLPQVIMALLREPPRLRLAEIIAPSVPSATAVYQRRTYFRATLGREMSLADALVRWTKSEQDAGVPTALSMGLAGEDATVFAHQASFDTLAHLEQYRRDRLSSREARGALAEIEPMLDRAPRTEIHRLVRRMPR